MPTYYVIRADQIVATIDTGAASVVALPLLGGGDALSLLDSRHASNLMTSLGLTASQALAALGLADLRATQLATVFVAPNPVSIAVSGIVAYHLANVGSYALWQVNGQQAELLALHNVLYAMSPASTLGLLAVVQTYGSAFYPSAVRTATGMTTTQALARRDRVATYLEGLGYTNTTALRAAMNEHAQAVGVAAALGYTEAQLWAKMAAV